MYEDEFLILSRLENIFWGIYSFYFLILDPIKMFRSDSSSANYLQISLFVVVLTYWCSEYVFYQNKKEVKKQYPHIIL